MRHRLFALTSLLFLAACAGSNALEELQNTSPAGDAFSTELAKGYKEYAEQKAEAYEWAVSEYFANKGLEAAYGRDIAPEDPKQWQVPADKLDELIEARTKLLTLVGVNRETQPALTAQAVVAYDRWVVANQGGSEEAIEKAKAKYNEIAPQLEMVQAAPVETRPPTTAPKDATSTVLYFPFDSDALGGTATAALRELEEVIKKSKTVSVSINGHTDRAGTDEYNMDLSTRRAQHVLKVMATDGIPEDIMKFFAFGETDPAVPTEDGVREAKNRRVEIYLEQPSQ